MLENKKEFKLIQKKNPRSLLPNALTIFGVCLGLSSIKFALDANYALSVIAIGLAAILDTLDGRVARLIRGTSKVGKELDSLTDVISFGVAPSFVMYFWTINEIGKEDDNKNDGWTKIEGIMDSGSVEIIDHTFVVPR